MDPTAQFVADLTIAVVGAAIGGFAARLVRLSPIVGYLLAGVVIGPFTPGYVANQQTINNLAQLGVIFLLFSIGLGFSLAELKSFGRTALLANIFVLPLLALAVGLAAVALHILHPITLALLSIVSSTAIGASLLKQRGLEEAKPGRLAFAVLISQDLIAVVLLIICSTPGESLSLSGIALPLIRATLFLVVALVLGASVLSRLYGWMVHHAPSEALIIGSTAVALVAAFAAYLAGLSFAFGAFIAGAVISEAAGSSTAQRLVAPFRDLLASLFFVSIGMLLNPKALLAAWPPILILAAVAVVTRALGWQQTFRLVGSRKVVAVTLGLAMVPLGEFNLVLAQAAAQTGRINAAELSQFLGVVVTSIVTAVLLMRAAEQLGKSQETSA